MNRRLLETICLIALLTLIFGFLHQRYVNAKVAAATERNFLVLDAQIAKQDLLITQITELLRTNQADDITARIVVDCSTDERERFDQLLEQLSRAISPTEIGELETLFHKCARFYADRKSIMASRLKRETEIYTEYVRMYGYLDEKAGATLGSRVSLLEQIADTELALAANFNRLVELQEAIITALKEGQARDSSDIEATLKEVSNVRIQMSNQSKEVERLRSELPSL